MNIEVLAAILYTSHRETPVSLWGNLSPLKKARWLRVARVATALRPGDCDGDLYPSIADSITEVSLNDAGGVTVTVSIAPPPDDIPMGDIS